MRNVWLRAAVALVGITTPVAAAAQMFTAGGGIAPAMAMNQLMMQPVRESVAQAISRSAVGAAKPGPAAATPPSRASVPSTRYRASPTVTDRVKRQYIAFIGKSLGPQAAGEYETALARRDFVTNWAQLVAPEGLRAGDAADALAAYWMLNYLMANGLVDVSGASGRVVAEQIRRSLVSNPTFARLNEAQRQEMAEVLMLNFITQQAAYEHAMGARDDALKRKLADAAVARFRNEMGVDLRQLRLTRAGFGPGG
ncbi:hypothetical protein LJR225_001202 [Phenylobacterium sp. LjRoot225]|uniref:DUF6683 family protein n=1 Tax=Phenylobacterium sp. LjRoot225 TaxID=3342285 RepID=UPI003ECD06C9